MSQSAPITPARRTAEEVERKKQEALARLAARKAATPVAAAAAALPSSGTSPPLRAISLPEAAAADATTPTAPPPPAAPSIWQQPRPAAEPEVLPGLEEAIAKAKLNREHQRPFKPCRPFTAEAKKACIEGLTKTHLPQVRKRLEAQAAAAVSKKPRIDPAAAEEDPYAHRAVRQDETDVAMHDHDDNAVQDPEADAPEETGFMHPVSTQSEREREKESAQPADEHLLTQSVRFALLLRSRFLLQLSLSRRWRTPRRMQRQLLQLRQLHSLLHPLPS